MERLELCCHTNMSKLQGIDFVEDYIDEAVKRGYKQIAITDTDSTQSFYRAEYYIKNNKKLNDFKIIYGAEMHFKTSKDDNRIYTIYIYVKNQKGLKNLYKLVSKAYENIVDDTPLLYKDDLTKYREGLLYASIGNKSEVYQSIESSYMNDIISYYDFIGIEPNESKKGINIKINKICKAQNKLLIGTSECNFINKEDYICNEVLNFYKKSSNIENGNNKYFQTTDELMNQFFYLENAKEIVVDNTIKIADSINQIAINLPRNIVPQIDNAQKIIYEKCVKKAIELYGHNMPRKITDRLELEIQSIVANKVESIYLITSDLADYSQIILAIK